MGDAVPKWQDILAAGPDKFNLSRETPHPVFGVVERTYNSLGECDQLSFMDAALFARGSFLVFGIPGNIFSCLTIVYNLNSAQVRIRVRLFLNQLYVH